MHILAALRRRRHGHTYDDLNNDPFGQRGFLQPGTVVGIDPGGEDYTAYCIRQGDTVISHGVIGSPGVITVPAARGKVINGRLVRQTVVVNVQGARRTGRAIDAEMKAMMEQRPTPNPGDMLAEVAAGMQLNPRDALAQLVIRRPQKYVPLPNLARFQVERAIEDREAWQTQQAWEKQQLMRQKLDQLPIRERS